MFLEDSLIESIKSGKAAVIPTDTLYGIVASALNPEAVENVYKLRRRTPDKPCIILISDVSQIQDLGINVSAFQQTFIDRYWPGPISLIFPTSRLDLDYLHRGTRKLALRLPSEPELRSFLDKTGPLIAPSANFEGQPPSATIDDAKKYFGDSVSYVNGGTRNAAPSGLIDLSSDEALILRPLPFRASPS